MKKHIPNLITCLNLLTGALGCFYLIERDYHHAIYFVIIAALFDFLDGFAARLLNVQSIIGKELDSLADLISFGLLPSIFMVMSLRSQIESPDPVYAFAGLMILIFSAIRLAKFNVDDRQTHQFIGLPTPANTIMITTIPFIPETIHLGFPTLLTITITSSLLLVANLPMIALKFKGMSWSENKWKYSLIIIALILLGILQEQALPFIIPVYLVLSLLEHLFFKQSVKADA